MGVVTRGWLALTLCACRAEALDREPLTEIAALQSISRTASLSSRRFTASVKALRTKRLNAARPPRPAASMTPRRRDLSSAWKQDAFRASKLEKACVVRSSYQKGHKGRGGSNRWSQDQCHFKMATELCERSLWVGSYQIAEVIGRFAVRPTGDWEHRDPRGEPAHSQKDEHLHHAPQA